MGPLTLKSIRKPSFTRCNGLYASNVLIPETDPLGSGGWSQGLALTLGHVIAPHHSPNFWTSFSSILAYLQQGPKWNSGWSCQEGKGTRKAIVKAMASRCGICTYVRKSAPYHLLEKYHNTRENLWGLCYEWAPHVSTMHDPGRSGRKYIIYTQTHTHISGTCTRGDTKNPGILTKSCVFILTRLNFSPHQSTLHLMQYTYQDIFPSTQNSFWAHWFWCLFVLLPFFVSPLPYWQNFSLWGFFFHSEKQKKLFGVRSGEWGFWAQGSCHFWSKAAEHSVQCRQVCS